MMEISVANYLVEQYMSGKSYSRVFYKRDTDAA